MNEVVKPAQHSGDQVNTSGEDPETEGNAIRETVKEVPVIDNKNRVRRKKEKKKKGICQIIV